MAPVTLVRLESTPDLVERVHAALSDAIASGTLAPGERVRQEDVAERLAVSRQPVLQALRMLKKDGLVLDAPGRGVIVAPLDPEWLAHLYEVRVALDVLAARLAAGRRAVLDPALMDTGRTAAAGGDIRAMIEADLAFHRAIYEASGNPFIARSAEPLWVHLSRAMGAVLRHAAQRDALWAEHERIVRAIARGDGERAARLIDDHGRKASANLLARLPTILQLASQGDPA
jgi:DNA-binding GntR family transcriptional regulator